ncbi:hypothetical protein BYT27DRAFT_7199647 [Phlegmacium glaucopus]|nr:hypothetical protein BYT27DRAFT_7199647 [Phlegmacium glaucopus]
MRLQNSPTPSVTLLSTALLINPGLQYVVSAAIVFKNAVITCRRIYQISQNHLGIHQLYSGAHSQRG